MLRVTSWKSEWNKFERKKSGYLGYVTNFSFLPIFYHFIRFREQKFSFLVEVLLKDVNSTKLIYITRDACLRTFPNYEIWMRIVTLQCLNYTCSLNAYVTFGSAICRSLSCNTACCYNTNISFFETNKNV